MEWEFLFSQQYINGVLVCLSMPSVHTCTRGQEGGFSRKGLLLTYSFFSFGQAMGYLSLCLLVQSPFYALAARMRSESIKEPDRGRGRAETLHGL